MEKNKYKNINSYYYYSTDRLFNILKMDLKIISRNNKGCLSLTSDEIDTIICEIEMVVHIIKLRLYKI